MLFGSDGDKNNQRNLQVKQLNKLENTKLISYITKVASSSKQVKNELK